MLCLFPRYLLNRQIWTFKFAWINLHHRLPLQLGYWIFSHIKWFFYKKLVFAHQNFSGRYQYKIKHHIFT